MKKISFIILLLVFAATTFAQKISYVVSFPNLIHHEALISLAVSDAGQRPAIFRMSRSSPGRYATHEFGKNVYDVKAFDKTGHPITINRIDGDVYEVPRPNGFVRVEYTLYGDYADGTYAGIDDNSVHLNMPAAFMWVKGLDNAPIDIKFNIPEGKNWTIATQLKPGADAKSFTAPGLQYFMDCPTKIGHLTWKDWKVTNPGGKSYRFRLALEANTTDTLAGTFAGKVGKIVNEARAVYGEVPDYDYGTYTFLASINPFVKGDGMEHRNSTMITLPMAFDGSDYILEVFAHEFFHCWNVERMRPKTLEPFNFEKSNMSNELWFAEGFTQYYGELIPERAGFTPLDNYLGVLAGLINTKENTAGAKRFSPAEMSRHAVFVDAGIAIDRTNYPNMFTSYYPYGGAIALALDLTLRAKYNLTLDNYMSAAWKKFGKAEQPYTIPGLQGVLEQVTGDKKFAEDFFSRYVYGHESFNYKPLLEKAGLVLRKASEGRAWLGNLQYREGNALAIASNTVIGTPLYAAGLDIDDELLEIDGKAVKKQSDIADILKIRKPGDSLHIVYKHRDDNRTATVRLAENPFYTVTSFEKEGLQVTPAILRFRKEWLETKLAAMQ